MDRIASKIYSSDLEHFLSQEHWKSRAFFFFHWHFIDVRKIKTALEFEFERTGKGIRKAIRANV